MKAVLGVVAVIVIIALIAGGMYVIAKNQMVTLNEQIKSNGAPVNVVRQTRAALLQNMRGRACPRQALRNLSAVLLEPNLAALHYTPAQNRFHHVCSSQAHTVCHRARSEGSAFYALEIAQQPNRGSKVREHFVRAQFQPCRKPTQKARSFSR